MKKYVKAALAGALQGIRETPRLYFAPLAAMGRWLLRTTEPQQRLQRPQRSQQATPRAARHR